MVIWLEVQAGKLILTKFQIEEAHDIFQSLFERYTYLSIIQSTFFMLINKREGLRND